MENTLKVLRAVKGVTQEQLAEDLGVTRQTIHAVESGKYNPSIDLAFKLAHYFDTTIEEIFQYEE
ncbi:transcriptional regulator [Candidatus Bathyarchaeota archaeon]|nr:transcriptional regulator [Candidatus Bathyarchaeota archaeon]